MINSDLINILCCPETRQRLRLADAALVEAVNRRIAAGTALCRGGQELKVPIEGGLVREDGQWLYPIQYGLPVLLVDEAIALK